MRSRNRDALRNERDYTVGRTGQSSCGREAAQCRTPPVGTPLPAVGEEPGCEVSEDEGQRGLCGPARVLQRPTGLGGSTVVPVPSALTAAKSCDLV